VARLQERHDANEVLRTEGPEALAQAKDSAVPYVAPGSNTSAQKQDADDEPLPLEDATSKPARFPVKALGIILGNAAMGIAQRAQAAEATAGQSVLAAANVIVQRHVGVRCLRVEPRPMSAASYLHPYS
jgi:hypothetical protein